MRARAADGPYAGQTLKIPRQAMDKVEWYPPLVISKTAVGPLVWIINGPDKHCYQLIENRPYGSWRLIFRETF